MSYEAIGVIASFVFVGFGVLIGFYIAKTFYNKQKMNIINEVNLKNEK